MVAIRMRWSGASLLMDHHISHLKGCSLAGSNFSGVCGQQVMQHVVEEEELGHAFILQDSQFLKQSGHIVQVALALWMRYWIIAIPEALDTDSHHLSTHFTRQRS